MFLTSASLLNILRSFKRGLIGLTLASLIKPKKLFSAVFFAEKNFEKVDLVLNDSAYTWLAPAIRGDKSFEIFLISPDYTLCKLIVLITRGAVVPCQH